MNLFANTIIDVSSMIIILLLFISGRRNGEQDYSQRVFDKMLLAVGTYLVSDLIAWYIDGVTFTGSYGIQILLNMVVFFMQMYFAFLWLTYSDYWLFRSEDRIRKRRNVYAIPLIIESVLLLINIYTGWIFKIDEITGFYSRGILFLPSMVLFYGYDIYALVLAARAYFETEDRERKNYCLWMAGFMVMPVGSSLVQAAYGSGVPVVALFYSLALLMIYLNVHQKQLSEQRRKLAQRDMELQRVNVSLMLSQIQPHFLYNALTAITELCHGKAPEAEEATMQFAEFLRCNLDSLKADRPIAFEQELRHTENYLALEKRRFEERLKVRWDINDRLFRLPALTLQPIVENAVKYGATKRPEGGTVTISSQNTENGHIVTVEDDGFGFDINAPLTDGRSHMGISGVRERLQAMCGGTLEVESTPGRGTKVMLTIPKGAGEE